ncbi:hypothetical protein ACJZ2D_009731 [Fusarium nematophilum]
MSERQCKFGPEAELSRPHTTKPLPTIPWETTQPLPTSEAGRAGMAAATGSFTFNMPPGLGSAVNLDHMEFLVRYSLSAFVPDVDDLLDQVGTQLALRAGLGLPCLQLENLAIPARRLAAQNPARSPFCLAHAVNLQAQAVESFNSTHMTIDRSNCVALLLLTSTLGRHLLIDNLARREPDLPRFMDRWVQQVAVHRGLRAVAFEAWPPLVESELEPILAWGGGLSTQKPRGGEMDGLIGLIAEEDEEEEEEESGLDTTSAAACPEVIHYLQLGLDNVSRSPPEKSRYHIVFNWSVLCPINFTALLHQLQPEPLIILAHYAVLLHHARGMWQVADSGKFLLRMISAHLGPEWREHLVWPHEVISGAQGSI